MPTNPHYESGPISDIGHLPNVVAVERFEGVLEKMHERCRQDNTRSEVFSNEEHNPWNRNVGGVGGDVGKRHSCSTQRSTLPSMAEEGPEGGLGRTKDGHDEDHRRRPGSLKRLGLSRGGSECLVHGGGEQRRTECLVLGRRDWKPAAVIGQWKRSAMHPCSHADDKR